VTVDDLLSNHFLASLCRFVLVDPVFISMSSTVVSFDSPVRLIPFIVINEAVCAFGICQALSMSRLSVSEAIESRQRDVLFELVIEGLGDSALIRRNLRIYSLRRSGIHSRTVPSD
jgi:hypothetical protein